MVNTCQKETQNSKPCLRRQVKTQKGQALLIVLLGMTVVLTLVLSIVSRSVTDVSITKRDEESLRAFSAAEAGVEQLLVGGAVSGSFPESSSSFTSSVTSTGGGVNYYNLPSEIASGDVGTIWFVSHDSSGNLSCNNLPCFAPGNNDSFSLCWGDNDANPIPAIEMSVYYDSLYPNVINNGDYSGVKVGRLTLDADSSRTNNFDRADTKPTENDCLVGGTDYGYGKANLKFKSITSYLDLPGQLLFARIKIFYNTLAQGAGIIVDNSLSLPSQGKQIESIGSSGESTRKVQVMQSYSEPLAIFENAVFSNLNLVKP